MQLANIRLGLATNSSSSHSIIILPKGKAALPTNPGGMGYEFGWECFVLSDPGPKMDYFIAQVYQAIVKEMGEDLAMVIISELVGEKLEAEDIEGTFVDHQSHLGFPRNAYTKRLSTTFIKDFRDYLQRPDIMVLGGNDNGDDPDEWGEHKTRDTIDWDIRKLREVDGSNYLAKKSGHWWTLFNQVTGAKLRLSFDKKPNELLRSATPELVDLKITNYCPANCAFCYQDSTIAGNHADYETIETYLEVLSARGVFEIAIGGGEPTLHPDFPAILKRARELDIIPNFTTFIRPDKWSYEVLRAVREYAGSYAVSISNHYDVKNIAGLNDAFGLRGVAHFVVGAHYSDKISYVIEECKEHGLPLTLLGFKNVGRGADFEEKEQDITPKLLLSAGRLSVDTAFVEQYKDVLDAAEIPDILVVEGEGRFSMYLDAVEGTAAISSYHDAPLIEYVPNIWNAEKLDEAWGKVYQ